MCCFSTPVTHVSGTQIFARLDGDTQFLVYQMMFEAQSDTAMILPLPVKLGSKESAVKFIDLKGFGEFFETLDAFFPKPAEADSLGAKGIEVAAPAAPPPLKVQAVGDFEASFVPSLADMDRLDPRFRISKETWLKIPEYKDYGFAVFKLKRGVTKPHAMAFSFPTRMPDQAFFPTVHIHDGEVHKLEHFDHTLLVQSKALDEALHLALPTAARDLAQGLAQSLKSVNDALMQRSKGVLAKDLRIHRTRIAGLNDNRDILKAVTASALRAVRLSEAASSTAPSEEPVAAESSATVAASVSSVAAPAVASSFLPLGIGGAVLAAGAGLLIWRRNTVKGR
jgi:hypothetical protein